MKEQTEAVLRAEIARLQGERAELVSVLATMLGAAETDCLDAGSNVWRSAMIEARAILEKQEGL